MEAQDIKKFIEEHKKKHHLIKIRCDNDYYYFDNADTQYNAPIIWDWDKEIFTVFKVNTGNVMNQATSPFSVTTLSFDQIQQLEAFLPAKDALDFIKSSYTDDKELQVALKHLENYGHPTMRQDSNRMYDPMGETGNKGNIRTEIKTIKKS